MENNSQKHDLAARTAIRYYEYQQSQSEIANALGISRSYVSQLLTFARETGIVKISVNVKSDYRREVAFLKHYTCKHVYIMNSDSESFTLSNIGRFAAPHITRLINNATTIGINLGESVQKAVSELDINDLVDSFNKVVVQMMGGYNSSYNSQAYLPNELVNMLSQLMNCRCMYLNCPTIMTNKELRDMMLEEQSIKEVIDRWKWIDLAIMGIGVANEASKTFTLLPDEMKERIRESKACCDININYFNESGDYLRLLDDKKISVPYEILRNVKNKVVIGYGANKARAIMAALRAKMIDVLITDSITADAIEKLEKAESRKPEAANI